MSQTVAVIAFLGTFTPYAFPGTFAEGAIIGPFSAARGTDTGSAAV